MPRQTLEHQRPQSQGLKVGRGGSLDLARRGAWTEAEETTCRSSYRAPHGLGEWGGDQNTEEPTCETSAMLSWNPRELNFPALWKRVKTNGWAPLIPDSASSHRPALGCFSVSLSLFESNLLNE